MTDDRDSAEWDAEIEAEFQRVVAATRAAGKRKRGGRHIGAPWAFVVALREAGMPWAAVAMALYIYRRSRVTGQHTFSLVGSELDEIQLDRKLRSRALLHLKAAGFVCTDKPGAGKSLQVTLVWKG
jgi:hypothetical protein